METFTATNGRVTGVLGLLTTAFIAVMFVISAPARIAVPGVIACLFAVVVLWGAMLRPSVSTTADDLLMRTLFETVTIPLAGIDTVLVRRYLLVRAGGTKYVCPAIGRSLRKTVRSEMKWSGGAQVLSPGAAITKDSSVIAASQVKRKGEIDYADFVEQRILHLAASARAARGIQERSEEEYDLGSQAVRRPFWPVVVALVVLGLAFVVALVVL
ncbi:MAG: hypothetical protein WAV00_08275 [Nocardioides sp.]